ncbi:ribosomal protein L11 methyltransferase [Lentibacillus kapialis]|uniref:Ribosomal protein L11 methyltransferase n=1 Tax=Lentibacillus kapialis TaxID=340214 RepID=A0A917UT31_9BACI|nr:50S ribosomal protein L11 methyltransferase [Lentibacillus kapialis]GGJ83421.1 ribosomal protein L11 methyltransferase [Lentibacillus kapialis]
MNWSEMRVHTTNEAVEPISNIMHEAGASGIVIEDPTDLVKERDTFFGEVYDLNADEYPEEGVYIKAYLPVNRSLGKMMKEIKQSINNLKFHDINLGRNEITFSEINEDEWATAWKKYYRPIKISEKITIVPTWEDYKPVSADEMIIELDPGMAFGTGTHPTTMLSIQAIEHYINKNDVVIDVGSGSGILSIASALLGSKEVYAFDLDDVAVKSTGINSKLNGIERKVFPEQNNLLEHIDMQADIIVSNILAEIIVRFIADAWNNLKPDGVFITSGIIQAKKQMVLDELVKAGFEIITIDEMEDWVSIVAKKNQRKSGV